MREDAFDHQASEDGFGRRLLVSIWSTLAAFGTYFCMYAFRKPFSVALYKGTSLWGIGYKPLLVISQVIGYTLAKFIGIKVVAEMRPSRRVPLLLGLIGCAEIALVCFGLAPNDFGFLWLFLNGIALGMTQLATNVSWFVVMA